MIDEQKKLLINRNQSIHGLGVAVGVGVDVLVGVTVALPVADGVTDGLAVGFGVTFLVGASVSVIVIVGTIVGVGVENMIFIEPSSGTGDTILEWLTKAPMMTMTKTIKPIMIVRAASVLLRSFI